MNGYGFLILSVALGVFGIGFYKMGPFLDRLSKRLHSNVERLRKGQS